jgi:hypothetical protein
MGCGLITQAGAVVNPLTAAGATSHMHMGASQLVSVLSKTYCNPRGAIGCLTLASAAANSLDELVLDGAHVLSGSSSLDRQFRSQTYS